MRYSGSYTVLVTVPFEEPESVHEIMRIMVMKMRAHHTSLFILFSFQSFSPDRASVLNRQVNFTAMLRVVGKYVFL